MEEGEGAKEKRRGRKLSGVKAKAWPNNKGRKGGTKAMMDYDVDHGAFRAFIGYY